MSVPVSQVPEMKWLRSSDTLQVANVHDREIPSVVVNLSDIEKREKSSSSLLFLLHFHSRPHHFHCSAAPLNAGNTGRAFRQEIRGLETFVPAVSLHHGSCRSTLLNLYLTFIIDDLVHGST
jgi:hypothetical protein